VPAELVIGPVNEVSSNNLSPEDGNWSSLRNVVFYSEYQNWQSPEIQEYQFEVGFNFKHLNFFTNFTRQLLNEKLNFLITEHLKLWSEIFKF
jgi:hypothetical protein